MTQQAKRETKCVYTHVFQSIFYTLIRTFRTNFCVVTLVIFFAIHNSIQARIVLAGDPNATSGVTSFSFTVSEHIMTSDSTLFVGAHADFTSTTTVMQYSVASYQVGAT